MIDGGKIIMGMNSDDNKNKCDKNCCGSDNCSCVASVLACLYNGLFWVLTPFLKIYFYIRCIYGKDRPDCICNHFGVPTAARPSSGKLIWIHAASVGESTAALTFINHLKKRHPELNILLTTITVASADVLSPKIKNIKGCIHQFSIVDHPAWVRKFLNYWKPDVAVFLESEIWHNIVEELSARAVPTFLLSARLSTRSFARWKMISSFFSKILGKFEAILAQSEIDCQRYRFFSAKNTLLMDNLKYANDPLPCKENLLKFFQKKCAGKKVFVAASTHEKEEDAIIDAHKMLRQKFDLVTVIIPRHTARIGDVCMVFEKHGVDYLLRSSIGDEQIAAALNSFDENIEQRQGIPNVLHDTKEIYCIDTFGEVGTFFRLADICFVGGSLVPIGGHNILEPVILGKPVLHGQFMDNAIEIRDFLKANKVAFEVHNANEIYNICLKLLTNPDELAEISKNALSISRNRALEQIDSMMRLQRFF